MLADLRRELASRGIFVARATLHRMLKQLDLTHKKRAFEPQSRTGRT